jgi:toxin ParE1/3/4
MKVLVSDKAASDLLQLYAYLLERNPSAARAAIETIHVKFSNLMHFPFIGRARSTLGAGVRSLIAGTQVIFYIVERERIVVLRVLDGRRDIDEEFKR